MEYRVLEKFGASCPPLVQAISVGQYMPNARAAEFDLEGLIRNLSSDMIEIRPGCAVPAFQEAVCSARLAHFPVEATEPSNTSSIFPWLASMFTSEAEVPVEPSQLSSPSTQILQDEQLARELQAEEEKVRQ